MLIFKEPYLIRTAGGDHYRNSFSAYGLSLSANVAQFRHITLYVNKLPVLFKCY
jgi:hypothetical protein